MKRSVGFFALVCLTISMSFSVKASETYYAIPDKPIESPQTSTQDNELLKPTSNKTYESKGYGFKIQLDENWVPSSATAVRDFGYSYSPSSITFYNVLYDTVLFVKLQALNGQANLHVLSQHIRSELLDTPGVSDVSVMENSNLGKMPFRYATFKLTENGQTTKCYYYVGAKSNYLYEFIAFNVTELNQNELSKALLSISIR